MLLGISEITVFFCGFSSNFIRIFFSWYVQRMWKYSSCELVCVFKLFKNIFLIYLEYIKKCFRYESTETG